jgi:hypothetical protein
MAIVEQLAFSLKEEGRGIHALLWDSLAELYHVLMITRAFLAETEIEPLLISTEPARIHELNDMIQRRLDDQIQREGEHGQDDGPPCPPHPIWALFIQQAASKQVGPRLNGWRRPLSEPNGTLLVVRNADFDDFQRSAPDLASFIGPRIYDASRLVVVCSKGTLSNLKKTLPEQFDQILRQLPGTAPTAIELADWTPLPVSDGG